MTKEEAIAKIKILKEDYWEDDGYGHETDDCQNTILALDMAIIKLAQEPCGDVISRQAAIDVLTKTSGIRGDALKALYDLPPVIPQYTEAEIQKMQDLESVEIQTAYELGKAEGVEVLEEIRAEIEQTRKIYLDMNDIDWLNGCDYVLSVIDKYKAESEVQDADSD